MGSTQSTWECICLGTIPEATQQLLTMLRLVLSCLLATQFVDSKPQWQYWPQLYQPYHYTQYALPIYSQNYLREAAVTGHFPGSNQKVTPYWGGVNFDNPRYFKAFCEAKTRKFGVLHMMFDKNGDGQVTFGEVNIVSLDSTHGAIVELNKAWDDTDGLELKILDKIVANILPKFNAADADNDQSLDMNEFADYATILYDLIRFYEKALRDRNPASPTFDDEKIAQNEWDCTQLDISGGSCNPNLYDQTLIDDMVGNDGDSMLSFTEYRNVMQFYKNVATQQGSWTQYC